MAGAHMHLGELEGIAEPVAGGLAAMVRRELDG